jgi:hypothetical protein
MVPRNLIAFLFSLRNTSNGLHDIACMVAAFERLRHGGGFFMFRIVFKLLIGFTLTMKFMVFVPFISNSSWYSNSTQSSLSPNGAKSHIFSNKHFLRIKCNILISLKVHKIEIFFGFDFEICIITLLVM